MTIYWLLWSAFATLLTAFTVGTWLHWRRLEKRAGDGEGDAAIVPAVGPASAILLVGGGVFLLGAGALVGVVIELWQ